MSLSSPSPSWFAKTPYCSVRDWTRFLRHRIKKYPDSPIHTLTDSLRIYFFPLWRAYLFFYRFAVEFAVYVWTVAVSATKKLRIPKYPYTCGRGLILDDRTKGIRMSEQLIVSTSVRFQFKTEKFLSPLAFGKIF